MTSPTPNPNSAANAANHPSNYQTNPGSDRNLPATPPHPAITPAWPATTPAPQTTERRLPGWRLWVPLLMQAALIIGVPAQDAYTMATGRLVTLQTAPVDPYDPLRGYYQTLGYEISSIDRLKQLPGGKWFNPDARGQVPQGYVYIVLEAPTVSQTNPPAVWQPIKVSPQRPTDLPDNQVALKGRYDGWRIVYGLETYYMPEDRRQEVNQAIADTPREAFVVETKIDAQGNSVPVSLWVRHRNFRF